MVNTKSAPRIYTRNRLCMMSCHRERRTWSRANERDNPLKRKRQSEGSQNAWRSGQRRKKKGEQLERRNRKKAKKKRNDKTDEDGREKEGTRHYESEGWDGTTKKARRIIIKRQGGKITHGAALASIHAFYSLAVIARTGRPTSYHLVSPAQCGSSHSWPFSLLISLWTPENTYERSVPQSEPVQDPLSSYSSLWDSHLTGCAYNAGSNDLTQIIKAI